MIALVEVVYWIINISLISSLVAGAILLYRRFMKYNPILNTLLWVVLACRLLIPISYVTPFSVVRLYEFLGLNVTSKESLQALFFTNVLSTAQNYHPFVLKSNELYSFFRFISLLWGTGVVFILTVTLASNLTLYHYLKRKGTEKTDHGLEIIRYPGIRSPFLFGIWRPIVFVPENLESSDMDLILLHEKAHYRRADNLKRLFALLLCTIHWFNPIVWRCFNRFTEDLEIETDRLVIQWIGQENKAKYFDQVIRYNQASFVFVGPAFSVNPTVRRIQTQFEERPGWVVTSGLFLMMILVSVLVFLANS